MKTLMPVASLIGLAMVFVPSLGYLAGWLDKDAMTSIMLAGTILWFGTVPFWMGRRASG